VTLEYGIVDVDTHYYEPPDCFTRYIEPAFRDRAVDATFHPDGTATIDWQGRDLGLLPPGNHFEMALKPGALREVMRAVKTGKTFEESGAYVPVQPDFCSRPERLVKMDQQGVEAAVMFPTTGILVEHHLRHNADAWYANLHAFNRWLLEDWGYAYEGRIFAAPQVSLLDPKRAVTELEWVIERGARVVFLRPGHANRQSPAHPMFDPFWARVQEAGVVTGLHIAESGYTEMYSTDFSELANPTPHEKSALQWALFYGDRPIMDTFGAMILHNLFGRFPSLKMLSVENGSLWVPYLLAVMDKMKGMGRSGKWLGGRVDGRPSDIFRQHVTVSPFHEESLSDLLAVLGPENIAIGSDYPHPEGINEPREYAESLHHLPDDVIRKLMRSNAARLVGLAP
jgi:predicted TIM-barrel fold metal-dependent hydrolase